MLFSLPLTSLPYFPKAIGGEALVRPASLYPLLLLIPISILPRLFRKPLPKNFLTLLLFVCFAVFFSVISLMRGIEPALGISVDSRVLRGIFTLGIGCAFYLAIALLPETIRDMEFSLRCIYSGLSMAMLWGSFQAINIIMPDPGYFEFLSRVQIHLSIRRLMPDRISGMTYEPHWFAEQIILLLVPYTLASVLNDYSVFKKRWGRVTIEMLLLVWAIGLLPFTYSRAGLLNLVIVIVISLVLTGIRQQYRSRQKQPNQKISSALLQLVKIFIIVAAISIPIYFVGSRNSFFSRIWAYWKSPQPSLAGYLSYLGFDARLIYAQAAFNMYQEYPLTGVGLGNYAFYFEEMLPYRNISEVPEILLMITPELGRDRLITSKNFFLRILAETGIIGGIVFGVFLLMHLAYALYLWFSPDHKWKYWGTASLCGLIAFSFSAITFDSFVIPNMWVLLGLITAATHISAREDPEWTAHRERNTRSQLGTA